MYKQLLNTFVTKEIIPWGTFQSTYAAEIQEQQEIFGGARSAESGARGLQGQWLGVAHESSMRQVVVCLLAHDSRHCFRSLCLS